MSPLSLPLPPSLSLSLSLPLSPSSLSLSPLSPPSLSLLSLPLSPLPPPPHSLSFPLKELLIRPYTLHVGSLPPPGPEEVVYEFTVSSLSKLSMIYTSTDAFFLGSYGSSFFSLCLIIIIIICPTGHCDDFWLILAGRRRTLGVFSVLMIDCPWKG